jgi:tetratricopeptide (TPR) repeat protein
METAHIDPEEFLSAAVEYGSLTGREASAVHLHLVQGCPECLRRLLAHCNLGSLEELGPVEDPYEALLVRAFQARGAGKVAWLESLSPKGRLEAVKKDKSLCCHVVIDGLLRRAKELWAGEPKLAFELTQLCVAMLPRLTETKHDLAESWDIALKVWAYHGNTYRALSELNEADLCFRQADQIIGKHPCDPEVEAEALALKAALFRDQRRHVDAQRAIDEAIRLCEQWSCWTDQGRYLLKSATIRCEAGHATAALADLERAIPLLDAAGDDRLRYVPIGLMVHLLCELGRAEEAKALLPHAQALCAAHGTGLDQMRLRWAEGRIASVLTFLEEAEAAYLEVRNSFIESGLAYDAALVSLDLAVLYAEQDRTAEIRALAQEMLTIFESRGVRSEALAAAFLFVKAVWKDEATLEALRSIRQHLKEAIRG